MKTYEEVQRMSKMAKTVQESINSTNEKISKYQSMINNIAKMDVQLKRLFPLVCDLEQTEKVLKTYEDKLKKAALYKSTTSTPDSSDSLKRSHKLAKQEFEALLNKLTEYGIRNRSDFDREMNDLIQQKSKIHLYKKSLASEIESQKAYELKLQALLAELEKYTDISQQNLHISPLNESDIDLDIYEKKSSVSITNKKIVPEQTITPELILEDVPSLDIVPEQTITPELISEDVPSPDIVPEQTITPEIILEDVPSPDIVPEQTNIQEDVDRNLIIQKAEFIIQQSEQEIIRVSEEINSLLQEKDTVLTKANEQELSNSLDAENSLQRELSTLEEIKNSEEAQINAQIEEYKLSEQNILVKINSNTEKIKEIRHTYKSLLSDSIKNIKSNLAQIPREHIFEKLDTENSSIIEHNSTEYFDKLSASFHNAKTIILDILHNSENLMLETKNAIKKLSEEVSLLENEVNEEKNILGELKNNTKLKNEKKHLILKDFKTSVDNAKKRKKEMLNAGNVLIKKSLGQIKDVENNISILEKKLKIHVLMIEEAKKYFENMFSSEAHHERTSYSMSVPAYENPQSPESEELEDVEMELVDADESLQSPEPEEIEAVELELVDETPQSPESEELEDVELELVDDVDETPQSPESEELEDVELELVDDVDETPQSPESEELEDVEMELVDETPQSPESEELEDVELELVDETPQSPESEELEDVEMEVVDADESPKIDSDLPINKINVDASVDSYPKIINIPNAETTVSEEKTPEPDSSASSQELCDPVLDSSKEFNMYPKNIKLALMQMTCEQVSDLDSLNKEFGKPLTLEDIADIKNNCSKEIDEVNSLYRQAIQDKERLEKVKEFVNTYKKSMEQMSRSTNASKKQHDKDTCYKNAIKAIHKMKQNGVQSITDFNMQLMKNKDTLQDISYKIELLNNRLDVIDNVKNGIERVFNQ